MARRRVQTPPFEIMGKAPAAPAPSRGGEAEDVGGKGGGSGSAAGGLAWWRSFDEPVVLRVPRGLAVLAVAVMVGIVVLGYWVGYQQGVVAGKREVEQRLEGQTNLLRPRPAPAAPAGAGEEPAAEAVVPGGAVLIEPAKDPREADRRYFVLAHVPRNAAGRQEAEELIRFVRQYGVEAAAVISDNTRFLSVVVLRGFTEDEVRSRSLGEFRQKLLSIGRDWKTAHGGRGSDLSDLYLDLYEGPGA